MRAHDHFIKVYDNLVAERREEHGEADSKPAARYCECTLLATRPLESSAGESIFTVSSHDVAEDNHERADDHDSAGSMAGAWFVPLSKRTAMRIVRATKMRGLRGLSGGRSHISIRAR